MSPFHSMIHERDSHLDQNLRGAAGGGRPPGTLRCADGVSKAHPQEQGQHGQLCLATGCKNASLSVCGPAQACMQVRSRAEPRSDAPAALSADPWNPLQTERKGLLSFPTSCIQHSPQYLVGV